MEGTYGLLETQLLIVFILIISVMKLKHMLPLCFIEWP